MAIAEARSARVCMYLVLGIVPLLALLQWIVVGRLDSAVLAASGMAVVVLFLVRIFDLRASMRREAGRSAERLEFQAAILDNVRESVIVTDLEGRVTHWNEGASRIFGYDAAEMLGGALSVIYPQQPEQLPIDLSEILAGTEYVGEWRGRRKDGATVWVNVHTAVMRDGSGAPTGFIGVASDVTGQRQQDGQVRRLATAIEQSHESVMIANLDAEIEYVNPAFERATGYRRDEVIGRNARVLNSGLQPRSFYDAMWATLTAGEPWVADFTNRRKDGSLFEEEAVISPIRDESGRITGYVAVKRDVTRERQLTGQVQRATRERALIAETIRGINAGQTPEVIADAVCRQVASLAGVVTAGLFVFEVDGRATPIGFTVAGESSAPLRRVPLRRSEYLRERADQGPWIQSWEDRPWHPYNDTFLRLGVRAIAYAPVRDGDDVIGFLHISSSAANSDEVLSGALPALVEFANIAGSLIGPKVVDRTRTQEARDAITAIIRRRAFRPVFQPIVEIEEGRTVGYEALTVFEDGEAPDLRFAEAASLGLGLELETATLAAALAAADQLPAGAWLNLNVSPDLILNGPELVDLISGGDRELILEITEHAAIGSYEEFRAAVGRLGGGVRVAVDDAGAGFASLRHILELRPAFVKLDRTLTHGIALDEARVAMVAGMQHFARSTGCQLIAEGVETAADLAALRALEIPLAQGYLLGRPAPLDTARADGGAVARPASSRSQRCAALARHRSSSARRQAPEVSAPVPK